MGSFDKIRANGPHGLKFEASKKKLHTCSVGIQTNIYSRFWGQLISLDMVSSDRLFMIL